MLNLIDKRCDWLVVNIYNFVPNTEKNRDRLIPRTKLHYGLLSSKMILDLVSFLYHILMKKMGAAGRHTAYMGWKGIVF